MIWTLRKKILIGYGLALVLVVIILVWALVNLLNLGRASDAILRENYKSIVAVEQLMDALRQQDGALLQMLLGNEAEGADLHREGESRFLQWVGRAKDNITIEGEAPIIREIETRYAAYRAHFDTFRALTQQDGMRARAFYRQTAFPSLQAVRTPCEQLREINQNVMFLASERAQYIAQNASWSGTIIGIAAVGIGLGFSLVLSNLLVRPLRQVMAAAKEIAEGHYDVEIIAQSSDELGQLAGEFNAMACKLRAYHNMNIEQILAEKRKSDAILQSIDDGIVVIDAGFRIEDINPIAARAFGISPEKTRGQHFLEAIGNESLFECIKRATESDHPPPIAEGRDILTSEGENAIRHYQFSVTPVHGDMQTRLVVLLRDVTKLKELDRLKSEFVMTASHQLKTPLTSMGMGIALLLERAVDKLDTKEQQLLRAAHEDVQHLKALANNLLDLSRIEAGKMEMEFDRVPVRILAEKAVVVFETQAAEKGVGLACDISAELPDVKADPTKITWVLTNLISNALRYTDSGGHIRVFAEQAGPYVQISVQDDGTGIPQEYQTRIFEKFIQVKGNRSAGGSGLGLSICKEIVQAHGGAIWVDSSPGRGSTFAFMLPKRQRE